MLHQYYLQPPSVITALAAPPPPQPTCRVESVPARTWRTFRPGSTEIMCWTTPPPRAVVMLLPLETPRSRHPSTRAGGLTCSSRSCFVGDRRRRHTPSSTSIGKPGWWCSCCCRVSHGAPCHRRRYATQVYYSCCRSISVAFVSTYSTCVRVAQRLIPNKPIATTPNNRTRFISSLLQVPQLPAGSAPGRGAGRTQSGRPSYCKRIFLFFFLATTQRSNPYPQIKVQDK